MFLSLSTFIIYLIAYDDVGAVEGTIMWTVFFIGAFIVIKSSKVNDRKFEKNNVRLEPSSNKENKPILKDEKEEVDLVKVDPSVEYKNELIKHLNNAAIELFNLYISNKHKADNHWIHLDNLLQEINEIIKDEFRFRSDVEFHMKNYLNFFIKKHKSLSVFFGFIYLYQSALAALSTYFNPSLKSLLTQYYWNSIEMLYSKVDPFEYNSVFESAYIVLIFDQIKGNTRRKVGTINDGNENVRCKFLIDKSISLFQESIKKYSRIKLQFIFMSYSTILIDQVYKNIDIPIEIDQNLCF